MSAAKGQSRERILGIDLGTTNSAAAIMEAGRPVIIPSAEGPTIAGKMFPSVVAFTKDAQLLVGEPALRQAVTNPEGTVFEIKRKMGTDYQVNIYGKDYTPQQISAFILQKIKKDAETFLSEKIKKCSRKFGTRSPSPSSGNRSSGTVRRTTRATRRWPSSRTSSFTSTRRGRARAGSSSSTPGAWAG